MYTNSITATFFNRCKLPLVLPTDQRLFEVAVGGLDDRRRARPRLCVARDTLHLQRLWVSPALAEAAETLPGIRVVAEPKPLTFDAGGALVLDDEG